MNVTRISKNVLAFVDNLDFLLNKETLLVIKKEHVIITRLSLIQYTLYTSIFLQ